MTNRGTITNSGNLVTLDINNISSVENYGSIIENSGNGVSSGGIINNYACGKIILVSSYINGGTTQNSGLIQTAFGLTNSGTFTNSGVLKYSTSTGTVASSGNGAVVVNNTPTPIFTYGGTFNGTVNGIFTNATATTSAGTFTAPNTFTPSGSLPVGSQTLYAKITPNGGACDYIVPFTYVYVVPPTLTAGAVTNATTCGGATGSIAFTTTNVPNGTYSLTFTTTGTSSPQNVTVSGNAFTLSGLTAGSYNDFSLTVSSQTATTGTLSPAKIVANPASPTLTAGTATNSTTCGGANGSIAFTSTNLADGAYSLSFTATGAGATTSPKGITVSGNAFNLTSLKAGAYSNFSVTVINGCTGSVSTSRTIADPASPTLTAGTVTNPTTCGGNGSIAFTSTNIPNGTYFLSFTATGAGATTSPQSITVSGNAFSLTGLKAGAYSNFSVTANGCTGTDATSKTVANPVIPTLTAGTVTNPTTCGGNGSIAFTSTNLPNGTYSLSFTATGAVATASPQNITVSGNAFSLTGLKAGAYSNFSVTVSGCTGTVATSRTLTDPAAPTLTVGTATIAVRLRVYNVFWGTLILFITYLFLFFFSSIP
jgi:trimeric autotransporter adhesin